MADRVEIEWPGDAYWPMAVVVDPVEDVWAHPLYRECSLGREIAEHRRPTTGLLATHPVSGAVLALIVRLPLDPPGERLTYTCRWGRNDQDDRRDSRDAQVDSRRWVGVRPDGVVMRATTSRDAALRDALRPYRETRAPRVPEAVPTGDDLESLAGLV